MQFTDRVCFEVVIWPFAMGAIESELEVLVPECDDGPEDAEGRDDEAPSERQHDFVTVRRERGRE